MNLILELDGWQNPKGQDLSTLAPLEHRFPRQKSSLEFFHALSCTERQTKDTEGPTPAGGRNIQGGSQYRFSDLQPTSGRGIGDLTKTKEVGGGDLWVGCLGKKQVWAGEGGRPSTQRVGVHLASVGKTHREEQDGAG